MPDNCYIYTRNQNYVKQKIWKIYKKKLAKDFIIWYYHIRTR